MGGELLSDPSEEPKRMSMSEIFWEAYPAYLTMGMSSEEYWDGDARACRAYRKKREEEMKLQDEAMWRQGAYFYQALVCVAPYFNSIRPRKPEPYIEPFSHIEAEQKDEESKQNQMNRAKALFHEWAANFNKARNNGGQQHKD